MNKEEFDSKVTACYDKCAKLLQTKNNEYSSYSNPLNNFDAFAGLAGITREEALLAYAGKQIAQIYNKNAIKNDPNYIERVMDVINYLVIYLVMLEEK